MHKVTLSCSFLFALSCSSTGAEPSSVAKSLSLIQHSADTYIGKRNCFSCHHQALSALTVAMARENGLTVDRKMARAQSQFTIRYFSQRKKQLLKGSGAPGGAYTVGYALLSLHADQWKPDETTDAMVQYLFKMQQGNGRWRIHTHRPPLEDSDFTATALSLRGLQLYGRDEAKKELPLKLFRARKWLAATKAKTHEDATFRLLGLKWSGASAEDIKAVTDAILAAQRKDGGWSQLSQLQSDAYATGLALIAIHQGGGLSVSHSAYQRGIRYLKGSQLKDGSWRVQTRSRPFQTYFESGFPHKKSQWISMAGTCWATMAIVLSERQKEKSKR